MRQRPIRNREKIIEECGDYLVQDPHSAKGHWLDIFQNDAPIRLELGCGKGQFITGLAQRDKDINFIACEGAYNVYPRVLQKLGELALPNVRLLAEYILNPSDFFEDGELSGIYLNFSDPWKKRTHKRRLTYRDKLIEYSRVCKKGAVLEFKTDNDELFDFSLKELEFCGFKPDIVLYDLHNSELASQNIMTEYEEKFTNQGVKIKFLRFTFT